MNEKPSYLSILNAITNGERRGYEFLSAWAGKTPDPELAAVLKTVAIREAEHAAAFEKRLCELGYSLIEKEDPRLGETMEIVTSELSDIEKFEKLGIGEPEPEGEDRLLQLLADKTIDPHTAGLLGRFIAEERDSGRLLQEARQRISGNGPVAEKTVTLAELSTQVESLTRMVNELQSGRGSKKSRVRALK